MVFLTIATALLVLFTFGHFPIVAAQSWLITSMTTHFMGSNSGLPGGAWPEQYRFNSSIEFVLARRGTGTHREVGDDLVAICGANWTRPAYPTEWVACDDRHVQW